MTGLELSEPVRLLFKRRYMHIDFDEELLGFCPELRLGHLIASVDIAPSPPDFWEMADPVLQDISHMTADAIRRQPVIAASRAAYKAFGQDPSRYRLSAEALHRRLMKDQGLYHLSNVVDMINFVSLESGFSIGGYDEDAIDKPVLLRLGTADDIYPSIGRGHLNIKNLPVLVDRQGPFGNPTSDSARTSIRPDTHHVWLVFFDFDGQGPLEAVLESTCHLLEDFAGAREVEYDVQSAD